VGNTEAAIACYQQALFYDPDLVAVHYNLGQLLRQMGKVEEAIACYQQVLQREPTHLHAQANLAVLWSQRGQLDDALQLCYQVVQQQPHNSQAHRNLGVVWHQQGQFQAAWDCYQRSLAQDSQDAETHYALGEWLLQHGEFLPGWAELDWRSHIPAIAPRSYPQPLWDGSPLRGKRILLHADYGFGDTIQFIRYAPLVAQQGGQVIVHCQPALVRLLQSIPDLMAVEVMGSEASFEFQASLLKLPQLFATTLATIPAQVPYLHPPNGHPPILPMQRDGHCRIGIAWAGNPSYPADYRRSCHLAQFLPFLNLPGLSFYSLQKGAKQAELAALPDRIALEDLSDRLHDFADTAMAMTQLDLIITTDTSVAHLAGALNRPVWVLLSYVPDWRWLLDREDSPWYPSMRLFRQPVLGAWDQVMDRVRRSLQEWIHRNPYS